jgi:hypothetical protein
MKEEIKMSITDSTVSVDTIVCFECDECHTVHFMTIKELLDLTEKEELFYIRHAIESFYDNTLDIILREPAVNKINLNYVFNKYKKLYGFKNKTELKQYKQFICILLYNLEYYRGNKTTVDMMPQLCSSNIYKCDFTDEDFKLYLDRLFSWYSLYPLTVSAIIRQDVYKWFPQEHWNRLLNYLPVWAKTKQNEDLNKFINVFEHIKYINDFINRRKNKNF